MAATPPPKTGSITLNNKTYNWSLEKSGDFKVLFSTPGSRSAATELVRNGSLTEAFTSNSDLYDSSKKEPTALGKELLSKSSSNAIAAGKNIPGQVINSDLERAVTQNKFLNPGESWDPGFNIGDALNSLLNNTFPGPKIEEYGTPADRLKELFKGPLKYPVNLLEQGQDVLVITQYTYKSPYNEVFEGKLKGNTLTGDSIFQKGAQRTSALKEKIADLYLPIPNNVSDSNGVDWGGNFMPTTSMAAAGDIPGALGALGMSGLAEYVSNKLNNIGLSNLTGPLDLISKNPDLLYAFLGGQMKNPAVLKNIQALILKGVGFNINPETILSRGYGVVANSNLELLFSGPTLRSFEFGYTLTPRSKSEAAMCRKIIRFFKQGMAPKKKYSSGGYGAASFLLGTPNVFKLRYRTVDANGRPKDIAGLNKFKICALTNMSTSYSDGMWAAFEEGQPIKMQINLAFKELEPIYESDYQDTISSEYAEALKINGNNKNTDLDQDPVKADEIGY